MKYNKFADPIIYFFKLLRRRRSIIFTQIILTNLLISLNAKHKKCLFIFRCVGLNISFNHFIYTGSNYDHMRTSPSLPLSVIERTNNDSNSTPNSSSNLKQDELSSNLTIDDRDSTR